MLDYKDLDQLPVPVPSAHVHIEALAAWRFGTIPHEPRASAPRTKLHPGPAQAQTVDMVGVLIAPVPQDRCRHAQRKRQHCDDVEDELPQSFHADILPRAPPRGWQSPRRGYTATMGLPQPVK